MKRTYHPTLPPPTVHVRADAFARFRSNHRRREELCGLPLAAVRALLGAREARFSGYLTIRSDLAAPAYLEVPFVRRAWRLLHFLGEEQTGGDDPLRADRFPAWLPAAGDRVADGSTVAEDSPQAIPASRVAEIAGRSRIPISWSMTRVLGMDRQTARVNIGVLLTILTAAGLLDPAEPTGLTAPARAFIRTGTVGEFYKALCLRVFNRVPWVFDDALPPLAAVQLNGLFLTYAITSAVDGLSAWELAGRLAALSHTLRVQSDRDYWVSDTATMATVIHARFLSRVGRMLGLFEEAGDGPGITDPVRMPYRTTGLCRRTFCWQL
ncbi:MAG: hypothetical protein PF508_09435 [Spirochaeta sp.]|nr:hypothetical protein [Spirochaeta sp.]